MFTGLIEDVGEVLSADRSPGGLRLGIGTRLGRDLRAGESIAVNGVCLTAVNPASDRFFADVSPATLDVTTLGRLPAGARVNLERALAADGRLGGHFVLGHVDGVGAIEEIRPEGESRWLTIGFPPALAAYFIRKGSVAVDGVSLTVAGLGERQFDVMVIPFTWTHTTLKALRKGDKVNIECDLIGKYAARAMELRRVQ